MTVLWDIFIKSEKKLQNLSVILFLLNIWNYNISNTMMLTCHQETINTMMLTCHQETIWISHLMTDLLLPK